MFFATLFIITGNWEQSRCPSVDECIKKNNVINLYNGMLLSNKNKWNSQVNRLRKDDLQWDNSDPKVQP